MTSSQVWALEVVEHIDVDAVDPEHAQRTVNVVLAAVDSPAECLAANVEVRRTTVADYLSDKEFAALIVAGSIYEVDA